MANSCFLSIITASYNRADLLPRCFDSLCQQTDLDFEWIIVDDGSTDHTEAVVQNFHTDLFPIIYHKKPNGGKHTALNASHEYIHGRYVLLLDSDDYLTESAIADVKSAWTKWEQFPDVGMLVFLKEKAFKRRHVLRRFGTRLWISCATGASAFTVAIAAKCYVPNSLRNIPSPYFQRTLSCGGCIMGARQLRL